MATENHIDSDAPIYLNLSGDYKIPVSGDRPRVGSVSGDLRLAALDAFLSSLSAAMSKSGDGKKERGLPEALAVAVERCLNENPGFKSVALAITSKLVPESHEMQYNFSVIVKK